MTETEAKELKLQVLNNLAEALDNAKIDKKYKNLLKGKTVDDLLLLPQFKVTESYLKYIVKIYTKTIYEGQSDSPEHLEGSFKLTSKESYFSREGLDGFNSKVLQNSSLLTIFSFSMNSDEGDSDEDLFLNLSKEAELKYKIANQSSLSNYSVGIKAKVLSIEPSSFSFYHEFYPAAIKLNLSGEEGIFCIIALCSKNEIIEGAENYLGTSKSPIFFDENKEFRSLKRGVFGYKLV